MKLRRRKKSDENRKQNRKSKHKPVEIEDSVQMNNTACTIENKNPR